MATQRRYSIEFKRQVVQEYQGGDTLHGLAKRHGISRNLVRIWAAKAEAGEFDDDLAAAVRRLADGLELPLHSVALAAHAKVLAALSGEQDVVTGYAAGPGGRPLPCPLTTESRPRHG